MAKVSSTTMAVRVSCFLPRLLLRTFVLPRASLLRAYTLIRAKHCGWVCVVNASEKGGKPFTGFTAASSVRVDRNFLPLARVHARRFPPTLHSRTTFRRLTFKNSTPPFSPLLFPSLLPSSSTPSFKSILAHVSSRYVSIHPITYFTKIFTIFL